MPKEAELNESKTETAGALNHFCGLLLMFSCTEESRPQLMGQIPEHYLSLNCCCSRIVPFYHCRRKKHASREIASSFCVFTKHNDLLTKRKCVSQH